MKGYRNVVSSAIASIARNQPYRLHLQLIAVRMALLYHHAVMRCACGIENILALVVAYEQWRQSPVAAIARNLQHCLLAARHHQKIMSRRPLQIKIGAHRAAIKSAIVSHGKSQLAHAFAHRPMSSMCHQEASTLSENQLSICRQINYLMRRALAALPRAE